LLQGRRKDEEKRKDESNNVHIHILLAKNRDVLDSNFLIPARARCDRISVGVSGQNWNWIA